MTIDFFLFIKNAGGTEGIYAKPIVITFLVYVRRIMGILNPPKINSLILDTVTLEVMSNGTTAYVRTERTIFSELHDDDLI